MKKPQNHPAPQPKQSSTQKESTNRHVYIEPGVKMDFVDDLKRQFQAAQDENTTHQNKNLFWTKIAAGVLLIYTLLTGWLGWLTKESLDNNTTQFQVDQRPYLWHDNVAHKISIEPNQRMWANIHMINYGKSPALKVRIKGFIFVGEDAQVQADRWFMSLDDREFTEPSEAEIVVPPGIPSALPEDFDKAMFGGGGFFTLTSEKILTPEEADYIRTHEEAAVIATRIQYFDGFGNRHWSDICLSRFTNGNLPGCVKHNEMH